MKEFYEGREEKAADLRAGERQEDFFSWFSKGGRVGVAEGGDDFKPKGGMTRRTFLKWLAALAAGATGIKVSPASPCLITAKTVSTALFKLIRGVCMEILFPSIPRGASTCFSQRLQGTIRVSSGGIFTPSNETAGMPYCLLKKVASTFSFTCPSFTSAVDNLELF